MKTTYKEDDLKMIKVEFLSNHWEDHSQILFKPKGNVLISLNNFLAISDDFRHFSFLPHSAQRKDSSYRKAEECYIFSLDHPTTHPPTHPHPPSREWIVTQWPLVRSSRNFKFRLRQPKRSVRLLQMKTTSYGRRPQNIKSGIYQQPLIGSYSHLKLKLRWPNYIIQIL
jgi:hypothetical protein